MQDSTILFIVTIISSGCVGPNVTGDPAMIQNVLDTKCYKNDIVEVEIETINSGVGGGVEINNLRSQEENFSISIDERRGIMKDINESDSQHKILVKTNQSLIPNQTYKAEIYANGNISEKAEECKVMEREKSSEYF